MAQKEQGRPDVTLAQPCTSRSLLIVLAMVSRPPLSAWRIAARADAALATSARRSSLAPLDSPERMAAGPVTNSDVATCRWSSGSDIFGSTGLATSSILNDDM